MQVILQKDVKNLGHAGDIVRVKPGYARNFLFPKNWAAPFTKSSGRELEHQKQWIASKKRKAIKERQGLAEKLKDMNISFQMEADSHGKLFGSVNAYRISQALEEKGLEVDKRIIQLKSSLKETGEHKVQIDLGLKEQVFINVKIKKKGEEKKKSEEKNIVEDNKEKTKPSASS